MSAEPPTPVVPPGRSPLLQRLKGSLRPRMVGQPVSPSNSATDLTSPVSTPTPTVMPTDELVVAELPAVADVAAPQPAVTSTDSLNPPHPGAGLSKEAPQLSVTVENPALDQAAGVQYVEAEKSHELPPEVEGFIKKVEDHVDQIPQEIVIADPQSGQQLPRVLAQPVVVLPITAKTEAAGQHQPTSHSIRWLIEWSWKMMKKFSGKIIYREEESRR